MNCPRCSRRLKVTHSYRAGGAAITQRVECPCGIVGVVHAALVQVDPPRGQGAATLAKRLRAGPSKLTGGD